MDLHKVRYFCAVADAASLRQAAVALRLSPGAVSKTIRHLENEFGIELFAHSGNKLVMTEAGKLLYDRGRQMIQDYESLGRSLRDLSNETREVLRLGTYCTFTTYLLDAVLSEGFADIDLHQSRIPPNDLETAILNNEVDIGLTYLPFAKEGIEFLPITDFEMDAFAVPGTFDNISLEDVPFVSSIAEVEGSPQEIRAIDGWPHKHLHRKIIYKVSGMDAALAIARQGLAAVYCPAFTVALHNESVNEANRLFPLKTDKTLSHKFEVYLVKRAAGKENAATKKLAASVRRLCRKVPTNPT